MEGRDVHEKALTSVKIVFDKENYSNPLSEFSRKAKLLIMI